VLRHKTLEKSKQNHNKTRKNNSRCAVPCDLEDCGAVCGSDCGAVGCCSTVTCSTACDGWVALSLCGSPSTWAVDDRRCSEGSGDDPSDLQCAPVVRWLLISTVSD
jgi:hypothetical protein